jgi:leucyl-tRNA synthetase
VNCKCPHCSGLARREVDTLDTFVDSSWYYLRFLDSLNPKRMFEVENMKKWMPVDIYVGGMEHAIMHLLYARFIHKFLCDVNGIKHEEGKFNILREPFKELIVQGLVKGKTHKLKSNGKYLFPDEIP